MAELLVANGKSQDWSEVYQEIKQDHDEAYSCIDKAIKLDEEGKSDQVDSIVILFFIEKEEMIFEFFFCRPLRCMNSV